MRRHTKRSILAVLLLVGGLYIVSQANFLITYWTVGGRTGDSRTGGGGTVDGGTGGVGTGDGGTGDGGTVDGGTGGGGTGGGGTGGVGTGDGGTGDGGTGDGGTAGLPASSLKPIPEKQWSLQVERLDRKVSWVEQGGFLPLNVTYQLLAGAPFTKQRFLTVGLSSVKRKKGSYLIQTLQSLFSQSSAEERSDMVVVVLLPDFDVSWRQATVTEIETTFSEELKLNQLVVLHVSQELYPPLTGLKRNYNDAPERVTYRSKQNVDYSFLMHYSVGLSQYYLQLEDDVLSAKHFLSAIKRRVSEQETKKTTWAMLEFSGLGYIGKLHKSEHLPLLARFLFLFYQEMPCDWLMSRFRDLLTQKETIIFKPSLFQHMGTFSSFQGTFNKLKDKDFEEDLYTNPSADVYSNMSHYKNHVPMLAWDAGEEYFWGRSPEAGSHLTVVFREAAVVTRIFVETGQAGKDLVESAQVEVGQDVVSTENEEKSCKRFQPVGTLQNGVFNIQEVDKKFPAASSCLRILLTAGQKDWVIVKKIRVSTKPSIPPHQL